MVYSTVHHDMYGTNDKLILHYTTRLSIYVHTRDNLDALPSSLRTFSIAAIVGDFVRQTPATATPGRLTTLAVCMRALLGRN